MSENTREKDFGESFKLGTDKPKDISEYKEWLKNKSYIESIEKTERHYESVTNSIKQKFEKSDFWKELNKNLIEYDSEYLINTGYHLLASETQTELHIKPFSSFLLKTFRKNILQNSDWPKKPKDGWVIPENWYSKINDIVRTLIVVKYIDGTQFMANKIEALCMKSVMDYGCNLEARPEGYYAAHINTKARFEIPKITWDTEMVEVSIEIQITTQLQEVIRKLLHKYYEDRRICGNIEDTIWQWNYKSNEFCANYLGHILHYIEGMIMEIREKQKEDEK
jgi:hypothetical protein